MQRSHKIQLIPNQAAMAYFRQACGIARLAYNVGLSRWKEEYEAGNKPTGRSIKAWFNSIKRERFPFVMDVTKCASERSFDHLQRAFTSFFKGISRYPSPKKKFKSRDSFYLANDKFSVNRKYIRIPKLGAVKMTEELRFEGKILGAVVSRHAGKWFVSISVELDNPIIQQCKGESQAVGIDRGLGVFAALSDGTVIENPRVFKRFKDKLRRLNKELSRRIKGSSNWKKTKNKLARLHKKIADYRSDFIHKFTRMVCDKYDIICLEDLNVRGLIRGMHSREWADVAHGEMRRQFEYKAKEVRYCNRFDPTSRTCHCCDWYNPDLTLSDREFICRGCGSVCDRDYNAAMNIRRWASPRKPVEKESLADRVKRTVKLPSMKQELINRSILELESR